MAMLMFPNAHHFTIGTFNVEAGTHIYQGAGPSRDPREYLYANIAAGAIHDSAERYYAPTCLEETREAVQADIMSWMTNDDEGAEPKSILWLTGPAGAGKSAIAGTIAETCKDRDLLAASFFFTSYTGSERRRDKRYLVPTLAYQISQLLGFEGYRDAVYACIQRDPAIFSRRLKTQVEALILGPLRTMRNSGTLLMRPTTIIVDGMDEVEAEGSRQLPPNEAQCANERDQGEVISALLHLANDKHHPFRVFISSRPERVIREELSRGPISLTELALDDKYNTDTDITLYLRCKFSEIRRRYNLPACWPPERYINQLVYNASGQFIYASTVVRCIQDRTAPPTERLHDLMRMPYLRDGVPNPLASLHQLYDRTLQYSPDPTLSAVWLRQVARSALRGMPALFVRQVLEDSPGEDHYLLENLTSLVYIPPFADEEVSPYRLYHRSLAEYLAYLHVHDHPEIRRAGSPSWSSAEDRLLTILQTKHPVVLLREPYQRYFFVNFSSIAVQVITELFFSDPSDHGAHEARDVNWWLCKIAEVSPDRLWSVMVTWFDLSHRGWGQSPSQADCSSRECTAACKHWRSSVLGFCRRNGWAAPSTTHLLREFMALACLNESRSVWLADEDEREVRNTSGAQGLEFPPDDQLTFDFEEFFNPPTESGERISSHPEEHEIEEYEALLQRVKAMYEQLPEDWLDLYLAEIQNMATIYSAFEDEISRIASRFPGLQV
ncbi:hypothetical protein NMY22_g11001 [Coprinellus aureogranulatus]|nr:hypothetical protein NMY22_g11001 [Coprinellus aureogranulatus]